MKNLKIFFFCLPIIVAITAFSNTKRNTIHHSDDIGPDSKQLFKEIASMDSLWDDAYNHCKIEQLSALFSDDLEFYHDQGGLSTSKEAVMKAYKDNICGKVNRELLKNSIEVYPIHNYGAVEMGMHRFYKNEDEKKSNHHFSKFVHIWKYETGHWVITRVISLH